jgi:hypothetical protein
MKPAFKAAVKDSVKEHKEHHKDGYMMPKVEHKMKHKMHEREKGEDMPRSDIGHDGHLEKVTLHGSGEHAYPHNKKLCKLGY